MQMVLHISLKHLVAPAQKYEKLDFVKLMIIGEEGIKSFFTIVSFEQEKLGINILDSDSIESGFLLESQWQPDAAYKILIDDQKNNVYIFFMII